MSYTGPGFRNLRYQFLPAGYDSAFDSSDGVVSYPTWPQTITLTADASNTYTISSTLVAFFKVIGPEEPGLNLKVGWLFNLYANLGISGTYMSARITAITYIVADGYWRIDFEAYDSSGSGTFDTWTFATHLLTGGSYVQNPKYSAVEQKNKEQNSTSTYSWPVGGSSITTVTSATSTLQSGYVTTTFNGLLTIFEDEYEYNRPYEGITLTSKRSVTVTTVTSTFTYTANPLDPPVITTTTTTASDSPITKGATISAGDFSPSSSTYVAGAGYPYPAPSYCTKTFTAIGSYVSTEYAYTYEAYYPVPGGPVSYRLTSTVDITRELGQAEGLEIDPPTFFPVAG